ncbi:energy-coupling factor transporter ATPase [Catenibacterium sp.]|uniref:energy-coupling factor transporter ATPase n=1 Tax=Catenibacterium sp. TaxID=2049022 RepID=UPI00399AF35B
MSIEFKKVNYIYGENTPFSYIALKDVSLKIPQGSFTALIGHTGSGKSTLIQHINALLLPSNGEVDIDEFVIRAEEKPEVLKPLRKKAGLVFQFPEYQLFEETIEKDIIFGPTNFGMSEEEAKERAGKVLKLVGLDESYLERSPFELSGGQKRRVAIAGILAMEPDILVLDEPTAGLDPQGAKEMLELFKKFQESGKTVIMVSHDMNHVLQYCDHVVVMNHGEVERYCDVDELFSERDYLESMSIDLPVITNFIQELNMGGFHINPSIKDIDELVDAIGGEYNG